ncbi:reverse transcriptase domain-containing protein [Tanacetum coccineum]
MEADAGADHSAGGGGLPVLDLRTMEELCHVLDSRGGIQCSDGNSKQRLLGLRMTMIQTSLNRLNGVSDDALRLHLFPYSLQDRVAEWNFRQRPDESLFEAWERYKLLIDRCPNHNMLPVTQIDTFYNGLTLRHRDTINAAAGGTFMKRRPEECYDLIADRPPYQ